MCESCIPGGGMGVYITTLVGAGTVIDSYYGTLIYDRLSNSTLKRPPVYCEGSSVMHVKYFARWGLRFNQKISDGQSLWIYQAPLSVMRLINDALFTETGVWSNSGE